MIDGTRVLETAFRGSIAVQDGAESLADVVTPALVLDRGVLMRNTRAMNERMRRHGVGLRPHLKTAKSAEVARLATAGQAGGITVSTLAEARYFIQHGFRDVTYAVSIVPSKLEAVATLQAPGTRLGMVTDDAGVARAIAAHPGSFDVLVEVDTGLHRAGVPPGSEALLEIARILHAAPRVRFEGVLTHAGHSYHCTNVADVARVAEEERRGVTLAAERLRAEGIACPTVSAGSTPTAVQAQSLAGVTEMRPGNYVFFDLAQVGLGSCQLGDIAVSVLASVIGHAPRFNRLLLDAGSLALSPDTSAAEHSPDVGFGLVLDAAGHLVQGLRVTRLNQEHGFVESEIPISFDRFPIGSRLRILPNHACITAAMHDVYHVVDGGDAVLAVWPRVNHW